MYFFAENEKMKVLNLHCKPTAEKRYVLWGKCSWGTIRSGNKGLYFKVGNCFKGTLWRNTVL